MAKNQRYTHNRHIAVTAPSDLKSGQPLILGAYAGVVITDATQGDQTALWLDGSYDFEVTGALTEGAQVYLKADGTLTATATGNKLFGISNTTKGTGTGIAEIAPYGKLPAVSA